MTIIITHLADPMKQISFIILDFIHLFDHMKWIYVYFIILGFINNSTVIWASTRENLSSGVYEQQRRRPACN